MSRSGPACTVDSGKTGKDDVLCIYTTLRSGIQLPALVNYNPEADTLKPLPVTSATSQGTAAQNHVPREDHWSEAWKCPSSPYVPWRKNEAQSPYLQRIPSLLKDIITSSFA